MQRDASEYEDLIREQMRFLRTSSRLFDDGDVGEAKRLATTLRVLFHSHRESRALLEQSGHLATLRFYDSAGELNPHNVATQDLLTMLRFTTGGGPNQPAQALYLPLLDDAPPRMRYSVGQQASALARGQKLPRAPGQHLPVEDWWGVAVLRDGAGADFTREALIKALANQDGGTHVDPGLDAAHHALSRSNSLGWFFNDGAEEKAMGSPIPASVRQIAHEVERTIRYQAPNLLPKQAAGTP